MTYINMASSGKGMTKSYTPYKRLVEILKHELHKRKAIEAGRKLAEDKDTQKKKSNAYRRKVHYLDKHIFQAMANLTFLFEATAKHPELQKLYEDNIKDLLGVRHDRSQEYGFMLSRLLRSILVIVDEEDEMRGRDKENDFRLKLNHVVQGVVCDKAKPSLLDVFKTYKAEENVWNDFHKTWGWTGMLAYNVGEEEEEPRRTFDFDTNELLK